MKIRHAFKSSQPNSADPSLVQPSHWNADHVITVENVEGDGTTNDTAAIQVALTATGTAGGGVVSLVKGIYKITADLIVPHGVYLEGAGVGQTILALSGALTPFNGISISGTAGTTTALSVTANIGARALTLTSVATAGVVIGDLLYLRRQSPTDAQSFYSLITKITSVVGNVVTLESVLPFSCATSDTHEVRKFNPFTNGVRNLSIDGTAATGAVVRGILATNTRDSTFENIVIKSTTDSGFNSTRGFYNRYENITLEKCTGMVGGPDIDIIENTGSVATNIRSLDSQGFGPKFTFSSYCVLDQWIAHGSASRGIKLHSLTGCTGSNLIVSNSGSTGIAITNGCLNNRFSNLISIGNQAASGNDIGLWLSDQDNIGNVFNGVTAFGNTLQDIYIGVTDLFNVLTGVRADPTKVLNDGAALITEFISNTTGLVSAFFGIDNGAGRGPEVRLFRESLSPAIADQIAALVWYGRDSAGNEQEYAAIGVTTDSVTSGSEQGRLDLNYWEGTTLVNGVTLNLPATTETALAIRRNLSGTITLQRVSMDAVDTAGAGFRGLRVPN